jgi:hypothetical protein
VAHNAKFFFGTRKDYFFFQLACVELNLNGTLKWKDRSYHFLTVIVTGSGCFLKEYGKQTFRVTHTPSVPKCLSLKNRVSLTDTFFGRQTKRNRVVCIFNMANFAEGHWKNA